MFSLFWDERLIPTREFPPFDYTPPPPRTVVDRITPADLQSFFVEYMKFDALGQIDNSWLALADRYGPSHPDCLRLCKLHSDVSQEKQPQHGWSVPLCCGS